MQGRDRPDAGAASAMLAEGIEALALELLGPPTSRGRFEWRWRGKGSLGVHVAGPKRGRFHDNEAGVHGDALDLVRHARGGAPSGALRWALGWLGEAGAARVAPTARRPPRAALPGKDADVAGRVILALRIWGEAEPARGTPADTYLHGRGLELPEGAPLRFHPACRRGAELLPAMLALMTDPATGEPCGVHRTFLTRDGSAKAPGQAKMMLGRAGAVRLVADEDVALGLGLAEGIETALAVMQRWRWRPVWAAASAGGVERFPVLPGVEALTVFADVDEGGAGVAAARACTARWALAGRETRVAAPPGPGDFADLAGRAA